MPSDDLILNALDVIEIRSETDLIITSNSQIKLRTTNILVNYIPLDVYIRKLLSPVIALSGVTSHSNVHSDYGATLTNITGLDQLDNDDDDTEMDIDTVFCRGNFADTSYVDANIEHYINISAASNIYFKHESFDDNILFDEYNRASSLYSLQTLKDYIYLIVNGTQRPGTLTPNLFNPIDYRNNLDHLGSFSGRKVICKKITTNQTELSDIEPILTFDSKTAINFYTDISSGYGSTSIGSNIYFGNDASSATDTSLDQLIYDQLSVGLAIAANFTPGLDIIMDLTSIIETPSTTSPYDIMFNIYEHVNVSFDNYPVLLQRYMAIPSGSANTFELNVTLPKPDSEVLTFNDYTFTNLEPGKFYTVIARTTNLRTDTVSYIFVEPQNIPTIKHVEIDEIVVVTEYSIRIRFRGHRTQVSDWTSASNRLVYFHTGIGADVDYDLSNDILTSAPPVTQNLSSSISDPMPTLYLNTTLTYIIPTTLSGSVHTTNPMEVDVISKHDDLPTSTFIMRKSALVTPYSFTAPSTAPTLTLHSTGDLFRWTLSSNTRIRDIFYNIYREATPDILLNSTILLNVSSTNDRTNVNRTTIFTAPNVCYSGIYPGYYKIRAYNSFNLLGPFSNRVQITDIIIVTQPVISFDINAQLKVSYTVSNNNGSFFIVYNETTTYNTPNNSHFYINATILNTYTAYIDVTDAFGLKIRSSSSNTLTVYQATITVTNLIFFLKPRIYQCTVTIDQTKSHNISTLGGISSSSRIEMVPEATDAATGIIKFTLNDTGQGIASVTVGADITGTDTYGFITNTVSLTSLTIPRPNITIGPLTYVSTRTFEATITSTSDTIDNFVVSVPGNCSITQSPNKIIVLVNNSSSDIDISYSVQLQSNLGFHSETVPKSETISINLGNLTATVFSITNSSYTFEIEYTGTNVTVTIAVSTSSSIMDATTFIIGSERVITDGSKTGTQPGSAYSSGVPYYLWGKVEDNRGFFIAYVYLHISQTIPIDLGLLTATAFTIINRTSYTFTLTYPVAIYTTVTIAVSTSSSSFYEVTGSERVISDGSKADTQGGSTYTYGQTYYLWGKVTHATGLSNSYVYLNKSQTITIDFIDLVATEFIVTNSSYNFTLTYTARFTTVTIAVSTFNASFALVSGSIHEIISGGSKTGNKGVPEFPYGQTYYLWCKATDNRGFTSSYVYLNIASALATPAPPVHPVITLTLLQQQVSHNKINLNILQNFNSVYTLLYYELSYTITNIAANLPGTTNITHSPIIANLHSSTTQIVLPLEQYTFPMMENNDLITVTVTKIYRETLPQTYSHTITAYKMTNPAAVVKTFYITGYNNVGQSGYLLPSNDMPVVQVIPTGLGYFYYTNYTNIQAGWGFMLMNLNGKIYTAGSNGYGQRGLGFIGGNVPDYTLIPTLTGNFNILYSGLLTVFAVDTDNKVYVWGLNGIGQVGNSTFSFSVPVPTQISQSIITSSNKVTSIGGTRESSLILTMSGLYVSGGNNFGERGDSNPDRYSVFTLVSNTPFDFRNVIEIICSHDTSYFVTKDRKLYAAGSNSFGQRGTGIENVRTTTPQLVTAFGASPTIKKVISNIVALFIVDENNILWGVGKNVPGTDGSPQYTAVQCSTISVKTIYTRPFTDNVHLIATDGTVYFSGVKFSSHSPEVWYREFIEVDSLLDENGNRGPISLNGQISTIFATNNVTFYST